MRFLLLTTMLWTTLGCQRATSPPPENIPVIPRPRRAVDETIYETPLTGTADALPNSPSAAAPAAEQRPPIEPVLPYPQWGFRDTVRDSLGRIGKPAVPALERMLRHPEAERRVEAAQILARIGPEAEEAVTGLIAALEDDDPQVRKAAARALGQIGARASEAVGPLLRCLEEAEDEQEIP